jgi:threonine dehydratase
MDNMQPSGSFKTRGVGKGVMWSDNDKIMPSEWVRMTACSGAQAIEEYRKHGEGTELVCSSGGNAGERTDDGALSHRLTLTRP